MAWVALWRAFHQTRKYSFLMISPKLHDISPFFLLIFSLLRTADFFILLRLLCHAAKNSLRGTRRINKRFKLVLIGRQILNVPKTILKKKRWMKITLTSHTINASSAPKTITGKHKAPRIISSTKSCKAPRTRNQTSKNV